MTLTTAMSITSDIVSLKMHNYNNVIVTRILTMNMRGSCLGALRRARNLTKSSSSHGGDCLDFGL
jgi:hypothetical protein